MMFYQMANLEKLHHLALINQQKKLLLIQQFLMII